MIRHAAIAASFLLSLAIACPAAARIPRSGAAVSQFKKQTPCPATQHIEKRCPGYIVDHIIPLCMGGPDVPKNMQWQTKPASLVKDKFERDACRFLQKNRARQSITKNC